MSELYQDPVVAFLPCRLGSERILNKNTKKFADEDNGLIGIKIKQLLQSSKIDQIIVSTNDLKIIDFIEQLNSKRIIVDKRIENLCSSSTSTDSLIEYVGNEILGANILWTHVTSPFITTEIYDDAINVYFNSKKNGTHDSLMSVTKMQKFLWDSHAPLNYDRKIEKWPRTQTLPSVFEVNSGIFLAHSSVYKKNSDRIGKKPILYEIHEFKAFDIDWPENWIIAEQLYWNKISKI
jgi:CMP-N-acetylneuraminic acid synthetase